MRKFVNCWFVWGLLAIAGFIGFVSGVIGDMEWLEILSWAAIIVGFLMLGVLFVIALVKRMFLQAGCIVAGVVFAAVFGFFTFILIGAGQHHPPVREEAEKYVYSSIHHPHMYFLKQF